MLILAICGSLQAKSGNLTLLQRAAALTPAGVTEQLYDGLRDLPHFSPDHARGESPRSVSELREAVSRSDALLIASPEYGHSLPGSLKNAIDWLSGTGELERKTVAITRAVPSTERGRLGLEALQNALAAVSAQLAFAEPIACDPRFDERVSALLRALIARAATPLEE